MTNNGKLIKMETRIILCQDQMSISEQKAQKQWKNSKENTGKFVPFENTDYFG